jgi:UDP-4-amino-4,6-dideoxy-N-acetyl-beta-L-altrosamine transaminase
MIPYGRQTITDDDVAAVAAVLRSEFLTQGPIVDEFERQMVQVCASGYAVAATNATAALHLACLALGVGEGDEVWTSPISFVASANCARYCGARVDFVDIDVETGNIAVDALSEKLAVANRQGKLPKVVIPVHFAGEPCDMASIGELAKQYGFFVIEDASHAVGARDQAAPIGACTFSDIAVFSFHPVKIITSGEGGMALTRSPELDDRMRVLRGHGIVRGQRLRKEPPDGPWYYEQHELGYNYRLSDIHAALGISQLARLETFLKKRHALAARYDDLLAGLPLQSLRRSARSISALHLYVVLLDESFGADKHREIFESMRSAGIGVQLHYIPIHLQPYYRAMGFDVGDFPNSENFYSRAMSLPLYPTLTNEEQETVVRSLAQALK